ncbi:MAG: phosphocholine cytidylyltransferase family protein, partial [Bacteroidales bacterium]|nr:phosphocholine cytidylyltransferase family protein [Bacteroidales bacterium]
MKDVILAAGLGTRLRPLTNDVPKCMVPVNGKYIIDKQIDNLIDAGINEIIVIAGYNAEKLISHLAIKYPSIKVVNNKRYDQTNNMYSLYMASDYVNGKDFLLMNADVYFDANIITGLVNSEKKNLIACDKTEYIEESMKVTTDSTEKINHISKKIGKDDYHAISIDVYKLSGKASAILFNEIKNTIEVDKEENMWTEVALDKILDQADFYPYIISGRWCEIDNYDDLAYAERIFKE